ncbi:hypothetical protein G9A89_000262 [Geosiphon pyriformis]|nr:hypothetical protein G9A89_000262 [Geosiphon pyriformis]
MVELLLYEESSTVSPNNLSTPNPYLERGVYRTAMSKAIVVGITGWWGGSYWDRNLTMPPNYAKAWTTIHLGGVYPRSYLAIPVPPYPLWIDRGSGCVVMEEVLKSNGPCTYELWEFGESTAWSIQYLTHPLVTYWEECTVESLYGYGVTIMVSTPLDSVHEGPLERLFGFPKGSDFRLWGAC